MLWRKCEMLGVDMASVTYMPGNKAPEHQPTYDSFFF